MTASLAIFATWRRARFCWAGCFLGNEVLLRANATVLQKVFICSKVIISAGTVVVRDITEPGTYAGVPARWIG